MSYGTPTSVVKINGFWYAVQQGTYVRKWQRQFTATLAANIVELNWVDRGPGIKTFDFTLHIVTWDPSSIPYKLGVTQTWDVQMANLETAYLAVNTSLAFIDVFGNSPIIPNTSTPGGVYFTNLNQNVPNYSTPEKPYVLVDIEVIEALKTVN
jgi:hypothetical protein